MDDALRKLKELDLPADDFAIFGSGCLIVRKLRSNFHDLDLIARGKAWDMALAKGEVSVAAFGDTVAAFHNGIIEIFNSWRPGEWNIDELIDTADTIDGVRYVSLENVIKWKKLRIDLNQKTIEKDENDIELAQNFLSTNLSNSSK